MVLHIDFGVIADMVRAAGEDSTRGANSSRQQYLCAQERARASRIAAQQAQQAQQQAQQEYWLQKNVNYAIATGVAAQRDALRAALRAISPHHKLLAPTGQFYSDGRAQIGEQIFHDEAFDRQLLRFVNCDPKAYRDYVVGPRKPLYSRSKQCGANDWIQLNINSAACYGIMAQRDALRAALRQVAPRHHLLMPTGRVYNDGASQTGDQVLYDTAFDKALLSTMNVNPHQHRRFTV